MFISIIAPVYNEEENIRPFVSEISGTMRSAGYPYELLLINDGSKDSSLKIMKEAKKDVPEIKIIDLNRNFGQTPAIMAGFHKAAGDIIITIDADLQNDPSDIPGLIEKIKTGYDLVSGWRRDRKDPLLTKVMPSKIANSIISRVLKTSIHDYGCTLKAYRKKVVKNLNLYGEMHRFIPALASWQGAKITETEVRHRPRKYGKTKYGMNRTFKVLLDLLLLAFLSEYSTKPIRFFGGIGLVSFFMGLLSSFTLVCMKILNNINMTGNPLLILSALFFLVSAQFVSMGFLGEINIRTYYESQDKKTYIIRDYIE